MIRTAPLPNPLRTAAAERPERCKGCSLRAAEICRAIFEASPQGIRPPAVRHLETGKMLIDQGERADFVGVLRQGFVRRTRMRMSGKRVLLDFAVPGDLIGGLTAQSADSALEAATDIEICTFDNAVVDHAFGESGRLRRLLMSETDLQHSRMLRWIWRYGTLDSRERIIAFLVAATEFMPTETQPDGSLILTIEVPRRDWADLTNTAVETISRTMRYLSEKNLVQSLSPARFHISDLDRLAFIAGVDVPEPTGLIPAPALIDRGRRGNKARPARDPSRAVPLKADRDPTADRTGTSFK